MSTLQPLSAGLSARPAEPYPTLPDGVARLHHLGVILIQGEDAAKFIHGQLTQDFSLIAPGEARLAAFCNAKGRMLASFVGFKNLQGDVLLVCSRDLLASTLKRLAMFVMRAKARLTDASESYPVWGLASSATKAIAAAAQQPWAKAEWGAEGSAQTVIQLYPAGAVARQLLIAQHQETPDGEPLSESLWQWGEVQSGVATLSAPLVEAFVPQMLNYESVGGVNFKKGCYPGQEVVARSQFRGTLKRRTFLAHCGGELQAGQEVLANNDPEQVAGMVVQAAPAPGGGYDALVELQLSYQNAPLSVGGADAPSSLALLPLPYELLEDL
jgi:folate-binding protein YgfZ